MKEDVNKLTGKTKEAPSALSTEDKKIRQLDDRRKELRKKGEQVREKERGRERVEYTEPNKTVKKKCRQGP